MSEFASISDPSEVIAIQQLLSRFARAADEGTVEQAVACFDPAGEWVMSGTAWKGRAEIAQGLAAIRSRGFAGPGSNSRHIVSNLFVEPAGDGRATAHSCFQLIAHAEGGPIVRALGTYTDDLIQGSAGWRIARREIGA